MSLQLLKSTTVVGAMTFISRILGFVREMVSAHFFGASGGYDAFIVASKIPNFLRRLFAEGAFSQAFVPILSEYRATREHHEVQTFVNRVSGCLGSALVLVTIVGILAAPFFVLIFAPGFASQESGDRLQLSSQMLQITFPYILFISLTAFAGGIQNSNGRFWGPAFTPVFLNLAMILTVFLFAHQFAEPVVSLAVGMLIGGIIQLFFQWPFLKRLNLLPTPQINWKDPGVRRILLLMVPALLGVSVNQLNLMLTSIFGSFLPVGSVSWLYYAERLMEFPLGGFGVALATVVLPKLSTHHAKAEDHHFSITLDWGIRWVLLIGLPAALGLALLAGPLLTTLFKSGKFTAMDVMMSRSCLIAYALGVMGFMLVKIFASAYYAKQDIKTPVRFAMITVAINAVLSLGLLLPLQHTGLALATSLAALSNAALLGFGLKFKKSFRFQPGWGVLCLRLISACILMSLTLWYFNPPLEEWFDLGFQDRLLKLTTLILMGVSAYVGTLFATGLRVNHVLTKAV